jgi:DNA-directed RNA polymerase sigma subunit (sigma70/sigma32)
MQTRRHAAAVESLRRQLEALAPAVSDILSERDLAILRGFCGLDGTAPSTTGVLAAQFELTQMTIGRIARQASKRLLADAHQARSASSAVRHAE